MTDRDRDLTADEIRTLLKQAATLTTDDNGAAIAVIPGAVWQTVVGEMADTRSQVQRAKDVLAQINAEPDDSDEPSWDEITQFNRENRLNFGDPDLSNWDEA